MFIELIELMLDNSLVFHANLLGQQKLTKLMKWICGCFFFPESCLSSEGVFRWNMICCNKATISHLFSKKECESK